jgi:hypothetical protein
MIPVRYVSLYYRDENKIMRKIPNIEIRISEKGATVYTLPPLKSAKIRLNDLKLKETR